MNYFKPDYTKELEPVSLGWYLKGFVKGLILWIPFLGFALVVPIIGWIFLPLVPFFPFIYPFLERESIKRQQNKLKKKHGIIDSAEKEFIAREKKRTSDN